MKHHQTRHGDEYQCSCGLAWGVGEDDPHPMMERSRPVPIRAPRTAGQQAIYQIRKGLENA